MEAGSWDGVCVVLRRLAQIGERVSEFKFNLHECELAHLYQVIYVGRLNKPCVCITAAMQKPIHGYESGGFRKRCRHGQTQAQ